MLSANAFILDIAEILLSGNEFKSKLQKVVCFKFISRSKKIILSLLTY